MQCVARKTTGKPWPKAEASSAAASAASIPPPPPPPKSTPLDADQRYVVRNISALLKAPRPPTSKPVGAKPAAAVWGPKPPAGPPPGRVAKRKAEDDGVDPRAEMFRIAAETRTVMEAEEAAVKAEEELEAATGAAVKAEEEELEAATVGVKAEQELEAATIACMEAEAAAVDVQMTPEDVEKMRARSEQIETMTAQNKAAGRAIAKAWG